MVFKATNAIAQEAYTVVRRAAVQLRLNLSGFVNTMSSGPVDFEFIRGVYRTLSRAQAQFDSLKTTPGLAEYAKVQESDQAYDVVAEFASMQSAIGSAMTWIEGNAPTNVTAKPASEWGDSDALISNTFTSAQTSGLRSALQGVVDTIA